MSGTIPIGNNEANFVDWRKPGINTLVLRDVAFICGVPKHSDAPVATTGDNGRPTLTIPIGRIDKTSDTRIINNHGGPKHGKGRICRPGSIVLKTANDAVIIIIADDPITPPRTVKVVNREDGANALERIEVIFRTVVD